MPDVGFGIKITADSQVGEAFAKIKSGLGDLEKIVRKTDAGTKDATKRTGMLGRELQRAGKFGKELGRDFREIGRAARDSVSRVGDILPPLAALTGAGTIAGLGALADNFAKFGGGVQRGAAGLGISTTAFQRYTSAAEYAGISSDTMAGAMGSLNARIHDAAYGLAGSGGVLWASKQFGIALRNGDGSVRSSTAVLGDLAHVIHGLTDPDDQRRVADMFGAGAMLNFLRGGRAGIARYLAMTRTLSVEQIRRGRELELSWVGLSQSAKIAGYSIASDLELHLVPLLDKMSSWLRNPGNEKWLGTEIEKFFSWVETINYAKVEKVIGQLDHLLDRLGGSGTGAGVLGGAGVLALLGLAGAPGAAVKGVAKAGLWGGKSLWNLILPAALGAGGLMSELGLGGVLSFLAAGAYPDSSPTNPTIFGVPQRNLALPRRSASSPAVQGFWGSIGSGIGAAGDWLHDLIFPPAHAAPMSFHGDAIGAGNWETQHNNFAGMRRIGVVAGPNSGGFQAFATPDAGVHAIAHQLGRYFTGKTTGHPLTTLREMISTWAPPTDHNPTAALIARASRLTGIGPDATIDWHDQMTRARVVEAFIRNEQGGRLPEAAAGALDRYSHHVVDVNLNGAPAGTRATVASAQGPAAVNLRVGYALDPAW